jgi:hypothetical protein
MSSEIGEVSWNHHLETYFVSTGERAECLSLLHKRAEELYSYRRTFIDLPVIVISSTTGFLSVGTATIFPGHEALASTLLGIASLFVGILNTTGAYFGWSKRAEGHRISSIHYAKLYRFLRIEMSLPRDERMSASDLLKYTKENVDRLAEVSPMLPPAIIEEFKKKYAQYTNISKPSETNGLESIGVFREQSVRITPASLDAETGSLSRNPSLLSPVSPKHPQESKTVPLEKVRPSQQTEEATISPEQVAVTISPANDIRVPRF